MRNTLKQIKSKSSTLRNATIILITSSVLMACSSNTRESEAYIANDEIKQGPGIFTGDKGAFYLVGGNNARKATKPVNKMSNEEATQAINQKLEQLNRDRVELEALKQQLKNNK